MKVTEMWKAGRGPTVSFPRIPIVVLICACVLAASAPGAEFSGFGSSVHFDKSAPDFTPEKLKGKAALVIFFQSWCPICNGWSGQLFTDVETAYGDNPGLMLIAIKTDGGSTKVAEKYMKTRGVDPDKWFVGSDTGAKYYKEISGGNELYGYMLVDVSGKIARQGKAGMRFASGRDKGKFALAGKSVLRSCGKLNTLLPLDGKYPGELARIARIAEMGDIGQALKQCTSALRSGYREEAKTLLANLEAAIKARIDSATAVLNDKQKDSGSRYEAYKELDALVKELAGQAVVAEARKLVLTMGREPAIRRESMAEREYQKIAVRLDKASDRSKPSIARQLKHVGERYADTQYGQRASREADEILGK